MSLDGEMAAFQEGVARGTLLVPECDACGRRHWYPRPFCPFCGGRALSWRETSGRGTIYSYSILRRSASPYCIAYVALEDGPTLLTNIVESPFERIAVGSPVAVRFTSLDDGPPLPAFALREEGGDA